MNSLPPIDETDAPKQGASEFKISIPTSIVEKIMARYKTEEDLEYVSHQVSMFLERLLAGEDIVAVIDVPRIIHRSSTVKRNVFEDITADFQGLYISGTKIDEAMFIPNPKLFYLLSKFETIAIINKERRIKEPQLLHNSGIRESDKLIIQ